jgi:hypothetical protein
MFGAAMLLGLLATFCAWRMHRLADGPAAVLSRA